jgi:hypothetical protein
MKYCLVTLVTWIQKKNRSKYCTKAGFCLLRWFLARGNGAVAQNWVPEEWTFNDLNRWDWVNAWLVAIVSSIPYYIV